MLFLTKTVALQKVASSHFKCGAFQMGRCYLRMMRDVVLIVFFGPALGILNLAGQSFSATSSLGILFLALTAEVFYFLAFVFAFRWVKEAIDRKRH